MKWLAACLIILHLASCKKGPSSESNSTLLTLDINEPTNAGLYNADLSASTSGSENIAIAETGFVLDTFSSPTFERNFRKVPVPSDPTGKFSASLKRLLPSLRYYVRAYAKTGDDIIYSASVFFDTFSEKIFYGDVLLTNQQEVVTFAANHYNRIAGDLNIQGDITDLTPLIDLGTIDRRLIVAYTTQLRSLDGLQKMWRANDTEGGFAIDIRDNQSLQHLQGLEGIISTTGEINIYRNSALTSLKGLDSLRYVKYGRLYIDNCAKLIDLHGLEGLQDVENEIGLIYNEGLVNVSALRNLKHAGALTVKGNSSLTNLNGFEGLDTLTGLDLTFNVNLGDIGALANLRSIYNLQIDSNKLTTLNGLHNITSLKNLQIEHSYMLTDISAISSVAHIENVRLVGTGLANLAGLSGITTAEKIELYQNNLLLSLDGLNNLQALQILRAAGNERLQSLQAIKNLEQLTEAHFQDNWGLADFCPLKKAFVKTPNIIFECISNGANPSNQEVIANCP